MEIANCLYRSPLVSKSGISQRFVAGNPQYEYRKRSSSSSNRQTTCTNAMGASSTQGFGSTFLSAGRRGQLYKMHSFHDCRMPQRRLKRACSSGLGDISDEDYLKHEDYLKNLQEMALKCYMENDKENVDGSAVLFKESSAEGDNKTRQGELQVQSLKTDRKLKSRLFPSAKPEIQSFSWPEPRWDEQRKTHCKIIPVTLEKKADCVGLPMSLRMLKKKHSKEKGMSSNGSKSSWADVSETAVRKAFSSMVFMIRELQSYTIQMRQLLNYGDIQEMLNSVQKDMHASFVWLFQQVFSCTPSLMVSIMILLANFTVYSMGNSVALAAVPTMESPPSIVAVSETKQYTITESLDMLASKTKETENQSLKFVDNSPDMDILDLQDGLGGGGAGGRNSAVVGDPDGDSHFNKASQNRAMFSEEKYAHPSISSIVNPSSTKESELSETTHGENVSENEVIFQRWQAFLKESINDLSNGVKALEHDIRRNLVAPLKVEIEPDNYACFDRTNLYYQQAIIADPQNALFLCNYARFLHVVKHDNQRAADYFKRAIDADRTDGEVIGLYAQFLWLACGDIEGAEEAFLEAIEVDPQNPDHAGNYANFLWNTGGEDTCFPLA